MAYLIDLLCLWFVFTIKFLEIVDLKNMKIFDFLRNAVSYRIQYWLHHQTALQKLTKRREEVQVYSCIKVIVMIMYKRLHFKNTSRNSDLNVEMQTSITQQWKPWYIWTTNFKIWTLHFFCVKKNINAE